MPTIRTGSQPGIGRKATILSYSNGFINVRLDEVGIAQDNIDLKIPLPSGWSNRFGEFFGKYPNVGDSVIIQQIQGGSWFVSSYYSSDNSTSSTNILSTDILDDFKPGRILAQVKNKIKLFLDPVIGIKFGNSDTYIHADPVNKIYSNNFDSNFEFSSASRKISGPIKRDISDNANRSLITSLLESHLYDKFLTTIGLDPSTKVSLTTYGLQTRNPSFSESREIIYEFSHNFKFESDEKEKNKYIDQNFNYVNENKHDMRPNVFGLSLEYPNHLIEEIKGTGIDSFGNILDINRHILPVGKSNNLSFNKSSDKEKTFSLIRQEERKSIAYHFEINSRKTEIPDLTKKEDYQRLNSKTFFDFDKEGTFKFNISSSSETGNIPLLTRYSNYSNLLAKKDFNSDSNSFVKSENGQDIFHSSYSINKGIKLISDNDKDGYFSLIDRFTNNSIELNCAYHDITKTCNEFLESANYLKAGLKLVDFHSANRLNTIVKPLKQIVSPEIIISGEKANAGGRSGMINLDGFLMINIGANTVDRQSLWLDFAGGIISNVGRDKNGISYAGNYDGDILIQVGGNGIDSSLDSRFQNESDLFRGGTIEIRQLTSGGQMNIWRMSNEGISVVTPGVFNVAAAQGINMKTNGIFNIDGEHVMFFGSSSKRTVNRTPACSI